MDAKDSSLDREMAKYRALLPTLADKAGKYIVIVGDEVLGYFDTWSDALQVGYRAVKDPRTPFLAKRIDLDEKPIYIRGWAV